MATYQKLILIILVGLLILSGVLFLAYKVADAKYGIGKKISLNLHPATVKKGDIKTQLSFPGIVDFNQHVNMQFQQIPTTGIQIIWIGPKVGETVKSGQVIAKLDQVELQNNLTAAQANYRSAQSNLQLVIDNTHLFQYGNGGFGNVGTPAETQSQKTARQQAEESVNTSFDSMHNAEKELNNANLTAPFDGIIIREDVSAAGVNITDPSTAQFEIVNPDTVFFNVNMDEVEVANIHEGDKGVVLLNSYPSNYMIGTVNQIAFNTHKDADNFDVYTVKIGMDNISNSGYKFRLGMTGNFIYNTFAQKVLYIPRDYLHTDDTGNWVYVGASRKKTYVVTGIADSDNIEIVNGLTPDDQIYY